MSNSEALRKAATEALRIFDWLERRSIYGDADMTAVHLNLRAALAQPAETDAELERRTGEPHIDGYPLFSGLPPPAQPAASGEPADPDPLHLSRILHEMAGAVSLCWEPRPSGVFESSTACGYVAAAIAEIRSRMTATAQPAHARVPLMDEQIRDLWSWSGTAEAETTANTQQHAFARAIETAHGITAPGAPDAQKGAA